MSRDHLLGNPAIASLGADARPARVMPQRVRFSAAEQAQRSALDTSRLKPGTRLRMDFKCAPNHGRLCTVKAISGRPDCPLVQVHFDGDSAADPVPFVASVFELVH